MSDGGSYTCAQVSRWTRTSVVDPIQVSQWTRTSVVDPMQVIQWTQISGFGV